MAFSTLSAALLVLVTLSPFMSAPAGAADTVFNVESAAVPAKTDRMSSARDAIKLKDWKKH